MEGDYALKWHGRGWGRVVLSTGLVSCRGKPGQELAAGFYREGRTGNYSRKSRRTRSLGAPPPCQSPWMTEARTLAGQEYGGLQFLCILGVRVPKVG